MEEHKSKMACSPADGSSRGVGGVARAGAEGRGVSAQLVQEVEHLPVKAFGPLLQTEGEEHRLLVREGGRLLGHHALQPRLGGGGGGGRQIREVQTDTHTHTERIIRYNGYKHCTAIIIILGSKVMAA